MGSKKKRIELATGSWFWVPIMNTAIMKEEGLPDDASSYWEGAMFKGSDVVAAVHKLIDDGLYKPDKSQRGKRNKYWDPKEQEVLIEALMLNRMDLYSDIASWFQHLYKKQVEAMTDADGKVKAQGWFEHNYRDASGNVILVPTRVPHEFSVSLPRQAKR